jgi:hypothetical protein
MLEIKGPTKVLMKIMGVDYDVRKPTIGEVEENAEQAKINDGDPSATVKQVISFIGKLGIPENVLRSLELDQLNEIMEYLNGSKKK